MSKVWYTVAETQHFEMRVKDRMSVKELDSFKTYIANNPEAGDTVVGAGGIRKVRWAVGNRGKSGGVRILFFNAHQAMPIFLLEVFAKNEKANIKASEKMMFHAVAKALVVAYARLKP